MRITIDQGQPIARPFSRCYANGCIADYEAGAELVTLLKQGQVLVIEGIDATNQQLTVTLPLTDFAQAYDGPSSVVTAIFEVQPWRSEEERRLLEKEGKLREEERERLCGTRP